MSSAGGPRKPTSNMAYCGVYYAIVTQNKDEQNKVGRVKVRFPWLPGGDSDQSQWALLAVPMVGDKFGTYTLPEVEDTVYVVFLGGDINHPVVIGGQWNQTDTIPEANENGKNDFRFIKSRSGHRLLLDDSDKAKAVLTDRTDGNFVGCGNFDKGGDGPNAYKLETPGAKNGSHTKGVAIASMEGTVNLWCPNGSLKIEAKHVEWVASDKGDVKAGGDMTLEGKSIKVAGMAGKFEGSKVKIN